MTGDKSRTSIFRHRTGRLSMICIDGNWRIAAAALLLATGGSAVAGSLGGPLELQDEGSFFVNGQPTQSTHPGTAVGGISQPGTITVNQMYVQYRIPKTVSGPAIVMVHGSGHTGATYETIPPRFIECRLVNVFGPKMPASARHHASPSYRVPPNSFAKMLAAGRGEAA